MTTDEATDYLISADTLGAETGIDTGTLAVWRARGEGPDWIKVSRRLVRYRRSAVDRWLEQREAATKTA